MAGADPAQGRTAFAEGQRLFLAGNHREALAWFQKGYVSTDDAAFLLNIAQCHRSLGEAGEALMMYRLFLKSSPEGVNPESRAVATQAVRELEREAAAPPATAKVAPATGAAATPVAVPAPAASPVPATTAPGRGYFVGPGEFPVLEPLPELNVQKAPEASATLPVDTESTVRRLRLAGMVFGAVGLVSFGAGVYYWSRASSLTDSANKATVFNPGDYEDGKRAETMQWIFYSVGAAAVMTGAGLFVYSRWLPPAKKASVSLAPMVAPGGAGLQAHGAF